jgi:hypothetical protein
MLSACGSYPVNAQPVQVANLQPNRQRSDLLYVSNNPTGKLLVFSYPDGESVGDVQVPSGGPVGLCSDSTGDVFVATQGSSNESNIYEYAHGGSQPIATLSDPGLSNGCAVDPTTGNLAVTNYFTPAGPSQGGDVAIYQVASGDWTTYSDPNLGVFGWCAYDDAGNLYVDGNNFSIIDELTPGGSGLSEITLTETIHPASMEWTAGSLAVVSEPDGSHGSDLVYQVAISGSEGIVSGPAVLRTKADRTSEGQFWIQGRAIIGPGHGEGRNRGNTLLEFWPYPKGGNPTKVIRLGLVMFGATVSHGTQ